MLLQKKLWNILQAKVAYDNMVSAYLLPVNYRAVMLTIERFDYISLNHTVENRYHKNVQWKLSLQVIVVIG